MTNATALFSRASTPWRADTEALLDRLLAATPADGELEPPGAAARGHALFEPWRRQAVPAVSGGGIRDAVRRAARSSALMAGAALECVHCYSLVHDDLPAMDNDASAARPADRAQEIRRGDRHPRRRRASHLRLRHPVAAADPSRCRRCASSSSCALARAAGIGGMAGGQMLDLAAEGRFAGNGPQRLGESEVRMLQAMKTGALLRFACQAGGILAAATAAAARGARALWIGGRPGLPDRRRSARSRRRSGACRQIRPARTRRPAKPPWSACSA